jgi:hypothetical protein
MIKNYGLFCQIDMIKDIWDSVPAEEDESEAGDQ